ncbi:MAG: hypothetical protein WBH44_03635 [Proteocatella sp.]
MKKALILVFILLFGLFANAYAEDDHKSIDLILSEIQKNQGSDSVDKIVPTEVSLAMLEELGDAVMEDLIGNTTMHERMDNHLGGEGSDTLAAIHQNIGYQYLLGNPNPLADIMGPGMMNSYNDGYNWKGGMNGMMGYPGYYGMMGYYGFLGPIIGGIFFIIIMLIVVFIYKALSKKASETGIINHADTPMDILKKRYAKGEITEEVFESMSKKLKE